MQYLVWVAATTTRDNPIEFYLKGSKIWHSILGTNRYSIPFGCQNLHKNCKWNLHSLKPTYGWWKKSCASWYRKLPCNYGVLYFLGGILPINSSTWKYAGPQKKTCTYVHEEGFGANSWTTSSNFFDPGNVTITITNSWSYTEITPAFQLTIRYISQSCKL